jgi:hypothetical protein
MRVDKRKLNAVVGGIRSRKTFPGCCDPRTCAVFLRAGRMGNVIVRGDEIRLGRCHIVTRGNLNSFQ